MSIGIFVEGCDMEQCLSEALNVKALYVYVYKDLYKTFIKVIRLTAFQTSGSV